MSRIRALVRVLLVCATAVLGAIPGAIGGAAAVAQPAGQPADDTAAIDEFARSFKALRESLGDLPKKIEDADRLVRANIDPATAQKQLDSLRAIVAQVLGLVVDNGTVATLGRSAVDAARGKLAEHRQGARFTPEQREYLVKEWQRVAGETESAVADLDAARKELAELLRLIQTNEDFLKELQELNQAHNTVEIIRTLTASLRDVSVRLRDLTHNRMKVPSM